MRSLIYVTAIFAGSKGSGCGGGTLDKARGVIETQCSRSSIITDQMCSEPVLERKEFEERESERSQIGTGNGKLFGKTSAELGSRSANWPNGC